MLLAKACDELPDYSFGEILYTAVRGLARKAGQSVNFLKEVQDEVLLVEVDDRILSEKEK